MLRLSLLLVALGSVSVVATVACSRALSDDDNDEEAALTSEPAPLTVIKGREWGRCWFDVAGDAARLSCTSTKRAAGDPLATTMEVTAGTPYANAFAAESRHLDLEHGGTEVIGTFARAAFPVLIIMEADLPRVAIAALGARKFLEVSSTLTVQRPEDLPAAKAAVLRQPFDLWPTAFIDVAGNGDFVIDAKYDVSIAPYRSFVDETAMPFEPSFVGADVKSKLRYWAAPATGPIRLRLTRQAAVSTQLTGPGYFAVTKDGLRDAAPEEIATAFPTAPSSGLDGGPDGAQASIDPPQLSIDAASGPTVDAASDVAATPDPRPVAAPTTSRLAPMAAAIQATATSRNDWHASHVATTGRRSAAMLRATSCAIRGMSTIRAPGPA